MFIALSPEYAAVPAQAATSSASTTPTTILKQNPQFRTSVDTYCTLLEPQNVPTEMQDCRLVLRMHHLPLPSPDAPPHPQPPGGPLAGTTGLKEQPRESPGLPLAPRVAQCGRRWCRPSCPPCEATGAAGRGPTRVSIALPECNVDELIYTLKLTTAVEMT